MTNSTTILRGTIWSAIGLWGRRLIGFAVFTILARHVEPASLGLAAIAIMCISFMELLSRQGVGLALIQRSGLNSALLSTAFYLNMATASLLVLINLLFAPQIARFMGEPGLTPILRVLSVVVIMSASNVVPVAIQSKSFDFRSITIQTFSGTAASALVSIPLAILGYEVWALAVQSVTFAIVNSLTIWLRTTWRPSAVFIVKECKSLTTFSLKILLNSIINFAKRRLDQFLIGIALGPAGLGLYALGLKFSETIESFVKAPLNQVAFPAFSLIKNHPIRLQNVLVRAMKINAVAMMPILSGIALLAPEVIVIFFGERWSGAVFVCIILTLRKLAESLFFLNYHVFISQGFAGTLNTLQILHMVGIAISTTIGKQWGIEGVAIGGLLVTMIFNVISVICLSVRTHISIWPLLDSLKNPFFASIAMGTSIQITRMLFISGDLNPVFSVAVLIPLGVITYIFSLQLLSPQLLKDTLELIQSVRQKKVYSKGPEKPTLLKS
ncbi:putative polysaccharide transport protein [Chitinispirillum alkaliphilum]|nr:putative polysaccharide transport protein [Chitinispirillum alkaliphilum]